MFRALFVLARWFWRLGCESAFKNSKFVEWAKANPWTLVIWLLWFVSIAMAGASMSLLKASMLKASQQKTTIQSLQKEVDVLTKQAAIDRSVISTLAARVTASKATIKPPIVVPMLPETKGKSHEPAKHASSKPPLETWIDAHPYRKPQYGNRPVPDRVRSGHSD